MLLLNAGQRPMSMKHQIDILSGGLAEDLQDLPGIEIIRLKDHKRRVRPGQFHLSTLAQAFQAWMQRSPNVDRTNLVVETMVVDEALELLGIDLTDKDGNQRDGFRQLVGWLLQLDRALGDEQNRFFGNDTVVLGFAAAIGFAHKNETLQNCLPGAMARMIADAEKDKEILGGTYLRPNSQERGHEAQQRRRGDSGLSIQSSTRIYHAGWDQSDGRVLECSPRA